MYNAAELKTNINGWKESPSRVQFTLDPNNNNNTVLVCVASVLTPKGSEVNGCSSLNYLEWCCRATARVRGLTESPCTLPKHVRNQSLWSDNASFLQRPPVHHGKFSSAAGPRKIFFCTFTLKETQQCCNVLLCN